MVSFIGLIENFPWASSSLSLESPPVIEKKVAKSLND